MSGQGKPDCPASPVGPASPSQAVCKLADCKDGALVLERLDNLLTSSKAKLKDLTIVWSAPSYRVAFEAIRGADNSDLAMGAEAMKEITEAAARVDKDNKRKEQSGWGAPANKSAKGGGWGSNPYPAQAPDPAQAQTGGWGQGNAPAQTWNEGKGGKGKSGKGKLYGHIGSSVLSHCESVRTEIRNFLSCHSSHNLGEPT